ncbi:MAG: glycosyltransferase family 2 protein [Anaerolineales bacterium]|nr:glycosyltransferase family 2 protein [Anaerolineales bacterium]
MANDRAKDASGLPVGNPQSLSEVDVSVCIVTYRARDLLRDCLCSLKENTRLNYEVIVVDNGSQDGVAEMLRQEFPSVRLIENKRNDGYTRPMNRALRLGSGRYLLQLNPDTLILPEAIDRMAAFMDDHPEAGICGPKVLNRDLTLQKPCRRGEPRPWAVITYFLGLSSLFPRSRLFGQYLMNYMDEDVTHPVAGVSGSCMLARRTMVEQIGFLDEAFFAYQEDADFCFRARQAGWQVIYYPEAKIIHYGSQGGSRVQPYRSIIEWHRSYYLYYRKHLAKDYFFLFNLFYYLAMIFKLLVTLGVNFLRREKFAGSRKP